ncbi:tyrosinase family oxidase copper chaperone [Streptomyces sp. Da 82-17]|uniref:tyrosinase family oxidase copper chaperone n=1 Tax=Streptomyces sp. Da 82-17 TaxID=3377116 RepID=UPI0038D4C109
MIPSRRVLMRSLLALPAAACASGCAAGGEKASAASHPAHPVHPEPQPGGTSAADVEFDEIYRGRRIQAVAESGDVPTLYIDHRPLHLMRCADGGYVTPIDHYQSCRTPIAAARAAVDVLGTAQLSRYAAAHGGGAEGSPHDVHA